MNPNMANRDVADLTFINYSTKVPFLYVDYANVTSYELTGEAVYAYGGHGHPRRVVFNGERGGTLTIETQIQPFKLYSMITGGAISATASFMKRDVITATGAGTATLSETPATNAEVNVFLADDDCGTPIEATVSGTSLSDMSGVEEGDKLVAYYLYDISDNVQKINIKNTTFPRSFTCYGETTYKTEDDEILPMKFIAYKLQPQSNISVSMSNTGDPATLTITCDLMVDGDGNLMDLIEITEEETASL